MLYAVEPRAHHHRDNQDEHPHELASKRGSDGFHTKPFLAQPEDHSPGRINVEHSTQAPGATTLSGAPYPRAAARHSGEGAGMRRLTPQSLPQASTTDIGPAPRGDHGARCNNKRGCMVGDHNTQYKDEETFERHLDVDPLPCLDLETARLSPTLPMLHLWTKTGETDYLPRPYIAF